MPIEILGDQPPADESRLGIVRIKSPEPVTWVSCSSVPYGQCIHWHGNRSQECTRDRSSCPGCKDNWVAKWQGYIHCVSISLDEEVFVEITKTAWRMIESQLRPGELLRGVQLRMRKTKGGAKGRYVIELLERRIDPALLPKPKDPLSLLRFLWRSKRRTVQV